MEPNNERDLGGLIARIADDVRKIAGDEMALATEELKKSARAAAADSAVALLGAIVALIGLGLLCSAAVVALGAWIPSLAARMLLMAVAYLAVGGVLAGMFGKKLSRDVQPDLHRTGLEARRTVHAIEEGARHA
jgi:hypothetical protein